MAKKKHRPNPSGKTNHRNNLQRRLDRAKRLWKSENYQKDLENAIKNIK